MEYQKKKQEVYLMKQKNMVKGQTVSNRTRSYLSPIVASHSPNFIREYICATRKTQNGYKLINTVGFFRGDLEFEDVFEAKDYLFIMVDTNGEWDEVNKKYRNIYKGREDFKKFVRQFRSRKKIFHWDYPYGNPFTSPYHIFVMDMKAYGFPPKDWSKTLTHFDKGEYSKMYDKTELGNLGFSKNHPSYQVLSGTKDLLKSKIEGYFGTILTDEDVKNMAEGDIPPLKRDEVLHWNKFNLKI